MSPSSEVAIPAAENYPAIFGANNLAEIITDNFGVDGIQPQDLDRIKVPAGGGTTWEIPTLAGTEPAAVLEGIVLYVQNPRKFWQTAMADGDEVTPPDCVSDDGVKGAGLYGLGSAQHPTGDCATCPMNQWGSGKNGSKSKACRESRLLYLLRPGTVIPLTVSLPATSIQPWRKYAMRLTGESKPYFGVVTKLALEKQGTGQKMYSRVVVSCSEVLADDQLAAVRAYVAPLRAAAEARATSRVTATEDHETVEADSTEVEAEAETADA